MTSAAVPAPYPTALGGTAPFSAYEWMLALRYLRARRKEGFISVIAGFSFLGIVLGVAVFVGMHTANQSVLFAFSRTVDRIAGKKLHGLGEGSKPVMGSQHD